MTRRARSPLDEATARLATIHERQVHRDGWPDFDAFDREAYPREMRRASARQWMRRASEELGSVHEFTAVAHVLSRERAPVHLLGSLARLITDEVRHAELCGRMAASCYPEGVGETGDDFVYREPRLPWGGPPSPAEGRQAALFWACDAILTSCCIGETLSLPLFEAAATVCTDPVMDAAIRQILRDEHLHATFGWEALSVLLRGLDDEMRARLEARLAYRLGQFERSCAAGLRLEDLANTEVTIEPGDPAHPNLSMLTPRQYATIFYATLESEILPRFAALGFDAAGAWAGRHAPMT
jgi:hypothetical protein